MRSKQERIHYTKRVQNRRARLANLWGIPDKAKHPDRWGTFIGEYRKKHTTCQCRRCKMANPKYHTKGENKKRWAEKRELSKID